MFIGSFIIFIYYWYNMASQLRSLTILAGLGLLLFVGDSRAQIITLDHASDTSGVWIDNACHYSDNPADFWVYGCPVNTPEALDSSGYWTACKTRTCDVLFNAGYLPKAKKLTVRAYIVGTPKIFILGKISHDDLISYLLIGEVGNSDGIAKWKEVEFELTTQVAALKITVGSAGGHVLLDSVTVDLGTEAPEPITLDTQTNEIKSHWNMDTCAYAEDYRDFAYYGCAVEPTGTDQSLSGYWTPCVVSSCQLQFFSSPTVHPASLLVRAYLNGSAEIRVTSKLNPKSGTGDSHLIRNINTENAGSGWIEEEINLDVNPDDTVVLIELMGSRGNIVLLDLLQVTTVPIITVTAGPTTATSGPTTATSGPTTATSGPTTATSGPTTVTDGTPTVTAETPTVPTDSSTSTENSTPDTSGAERCSTQSKALFTTVFLLSFQTLQLLIQ